MAGSIRWSVNSRFNWSNKLTRDSVKIIKTQPCIILNWISSINPNHDVDFRLDNVLKVRFYIYTRMFWIHDLCPSSCSLRISVIMHVIDGCTSGLSWALTESANPSLCFARFGLARKAPQRRRSVRVISWGIGFLDSKSFVFCRHAKKNRLLFLI
jgi:hypothetical protein